MNPVPPSFLPCSWAAEHNGLGLLVLMLSAV